MDYFLPIQVFLSRLTNSIPMNHFSITFGLNLV